MVQVPQHQVPGVYHRRIGDIVVTALSDGYLDGTVDVLRNIDRGRHPHADRGVPPRAAQFRELLRHPLRRTAGADRNRVGQLSATHRRAPAIQSARRRDRPGGDRAGAAHAYPSGPLRRPEDPATGRRLFPNAELVVHENDPRHWDDDAAMAQASERAKKLYFEAAREQIAPSRDRLRTFNSSKDVFPGITAMPLNGHTPGHSGYMMRRATNSLLIWGDIIHVPEIQVPRPEVTIEFDTDPAAAAATRRRTFDMVASDRLLIAGMHVHYPVSRMWSATATARLAAGAVGPGFLTSGNLHPSLPPTTCYNRRCDTHTGRDNKGGGMVARLDRDAKRVALLSSPLFEAMNSEELEEVLRLSSERRVTRGASIFQKGDEGSSMMAVLAGRVRVSSVSVEGREITLNVIDPGEVFGEIALLDGKPRSADCTAIEETMLLVLERRHFLPFLQRHESLYLRLIAVLCDKLAQYQHGAGGVGAIRSARAAGSRAAETCTRLWAADAAGHSHRREDVAARPVEPGRLHAREREQAAPYLARRSSCRSGWRLPDPCRPDELRMLVE